MIYTQATIKYFIAISLMAVMLWGCTGLRKLGEDERLFSGSKIEYDSVHFLHEPRATKSEIRDIVKPEPNIKFLWMRPFLSIHNMVKEPDQEKGFRYWIKYKIGAPPVKLNDLNLQQINTAMVNRLQNRGHFNASSSYETFKKRKTASVKFYESPRKPYIIQSIKFPEGNSDIITKIYGLRKSTLIKPDKTYKLVDFEDERNRIDKSLKDIGYFYFSPNYLVFDADTTIGSYQIDLNLKLKPDIPPDSRNAFRLGKVVIFDDYSLRNYHPDTVSIDGYMYLSAKHFFKPSAILDAIFLKKDSLYSREKHYNTISHLMGLGVYKYANARFSKADSASNILDVDIILTPAKKMSVGTEVSAQLKTNNYVGPGVKLSFKNRNIFRGAEMFSINLGGRFETQFSGDNVGETNYEITLDGSLNIPRYVPFKFGKNTVRRYVPSTVITVGGGLFSRVRLYELHSFYTSMGYNWRTNEKISQVLNPVDVSYTNLAKSSKEFEDYLDKNPTIRKSFEEQFILGISYTFTYSNLFLRKKRTNFYYSGSLGLAGNLAGLITTAALGSRPTAENPHKILGVPYSQYARLRNEIRFFINMSKQNQLGFRVIVANGIPYGNSSTLPYVKQFYVGGTNSVRAFRARTVGPGSYNPPDSLSNLYIDQSGDIKLETSIEYRFTIVNFLKSALFVDVGNIWLASEDEQRPGGKFNSKTFYKELAVGGGLGFRLDFSVVVIRFDFAFPMRKPYLPEGERWVFDKIQLGSKSWRKENILLNIAIGYPF